jgi:hypothetical protein
MIKFLSAKYFSQEYHSRTGGVAQVAECLFASKHEALNLNPSSVKKKKKKKDTFLVMFFLTLSHQQAKMID